MSTDVEGGMLLMFWLNQARWRRAEEEMVATSAARSGNSSEGKRPTLGEKNRTRCGKSSNVIHSGQPCRCNGAWERERRETGAHLGPAGKHCDGAGGSCSSQAAVRCHAIRPNPTLPSVLRDVDILYDTPSQACTVGRTSSERGSGLTLLLSTGELSGFPL
jgi:hypothetical protein